jgi:hypothetical protein
MEEGELAGAIQVERPNIFRAVQEELPGLLKSLEAAGFPQAQFQVAWAQEGGG